MKFVLVTGLAATALIGVGIALGPHDQRESVHTATPGDPAAASVNDLDRYVTRTVAHLTRTPGDWQAWAQLGMAQLELARRSSDPARYADAETALRRSLKVQPQDNAAALTGLGALAAARHEFTTALSYARRAVTVDAYSADAFGVLTDACVELGRYDEATDAVQRMLDLRPDTGSYARASYLFELRGDQARAVDLMQQALAVAATAGDTTFALTHLGELAFNTGDLTTAAEYFHRGLARTPGQPALLAWQARVQAARGDLPAAVAALRTVTLTLPTVDHLAALSDTLTAAGDPGGAERTDELVRASTRLPAGSSGTTDIDLVLFYADRGQASQAVTRAAALYATRPSVAVESAYAWALHAAGRDREALTHAERSLRLGTRDARAHYYRGQIRLTLGDRAGARADLHQALAINPHFSLRYAPHARAALDRLKDAA
ncbi:tetratricopeptide repeat protein [Actinoplanes sp. NPDC051859]|uniref:tetratricopeptide repeat protein n=1 Tax=Actinoplanes sp. NPDC051859 TaxID=3363909 RepID=UPI00379D37C0